MEQPRVEDAAARPTLAPESDEAKSLGARLRAAREAAGLSQRKLAPLAGIDRRTIYAAESGQRIPIPEVIERIASVLETSAEAIYGVARTCQRRDCARRTFGAYCSFHQPKPRGVPVPHRRDRDERGTDGDRLRAARLARGLTQEGLGALVGLSSSSISKLERGGDRPSRASAASLRQVLGLPDLYPVAPCPCGCGEDSPNGQLINRHKTAAMRAHLSQVIRPLKVAWWTSEESANHRSQLADAWRLHWERVTGPVDVMVMSKRRDHYKPTTRKVLGQRKGGHTAPKGDVRRGAKRKYGERTRADVVAELNIAVRKNPNLGLRPLAERVGLTRRQLEYLSREPDVQAILAQRNTHAVSQKSSARA